MSLWTKVNGFLTVPPESVIEGTGFVALAQVSHPSGSSLVLALLHVQLCRPLSPVPLQTRSLRQTPHPRPPREPSQSLNVFFPLIQNMSACGLAWGASAPNFLTKRRHPPTPRAKSHHLLLNPPPHPSFFFLLCLVCFLPCALAFL